MALWEPLRCRLGRHEWVVETDDNGDARTSCRRCHDLRPHAGQAGAAGPTMLPGAWGQRA
jgi:hypothetical protein